MKIKVLAALLLSTAAAVAGPHDDLSVARQREQAALVRVNYFEIQTAIAERDIATARIVQDTATKQRNQTRLAQAVKEERDAQDRAALARQEVDRARAEQKLASAEIRRLERVTKR